MPVYEYACTSCGHHHEVSQSFSDAPLTVCPDCGGALRKVFGSIGIVLKGSGFYRTDSRAAASNGKAKKKETEGAGSSTGSSSSNGSSSEGGKAKEPGTSKGTTAESSSGSSTSGAAAPSGAEGGAASSTSKAASG